MTWTLKNVSFADDVPRASIYEETNIELGIQCEASKVKLRQKFQTSIRSVTSRCITATAVSDRVSLQQYTISCPIFREE